MLEYEAQDKSIRGQVMIDVERIAGETATEYNKRQHAQRNTLIVALKSQGQPYEYNPAFSAQLSAENQKLDQEVLDAGPDSDEKMARGRAEVWIESLDLAIEEQAAQDDFDAADMALKIVDNEVRANLLQRVMEKMKHAARQRTL